VLNKLIPNYLELFINLFWNSLLRSPRNSNVFVTSVMKNPSWLYKVWKLHSLSFYVSLLLLAQCHLKI